MPAMKLSNKLALAGVIAVTLVGAAFTRSFAYKLYFEQLPIGRPMPTGQFLTAVAGWALATYGPILVAALFWNLAKRFPVLWILHVLLPLCLYRLLFAGNALMLSALEVGDFDATMGGPIMPAFFVIIVTLVVYFSALIVSKWKAHSSGR